MTRERKRKEKVTCLSLPTHTHTIATLKHNNEKFVLPIIAILIIIITTIKKIHS